VIAVLATTHAPPDAPCSFCGKKVGEPVSDFRPEPLVRYVIQGPKVTICDACVSLCGEMLSENGIVAREPCTLDNCGHMRQLDAIVDLLGMPRGTRSVLDELRARAAAEWEDIPDEWTDAIKSAHPGHGSESHDEYGVAMQMVGHRHSKGELVALVNWLLVCLKTSRAATLLEAEQVIREVLPGHWTAIERFRDMSTTESLPNKEGKPVTAEEVVREISMDVARSTESKRTEIDP